MKNRKLLLIVSVVLALTMSLGGTLAYLTDTDADVNTMVLGNVQIVQNEQMRDENGELVEYKDKPILPAVYEKEDWADEKLTISGGEFKFFDPEMKNVNDKIVTVTNTGNTAAYVRTIIAIEAPDKTDKYEAFNDDLVHVNVNETQGVTRSDWAYVTTDDGVRYVYAIFTYTEALAAKATSLPSLLQVFLDKEIDNEDIEMLGEEWEIIALSQAVQADGFANVAAAFKAAFDKDADKPSDALLKEWLAKAKGDIGSPGDKNTTNNPPVFEAANAAELEVLLNKGANVALVENVDYGTFEIDGELNGVTIQGATGANVRFNIMSTAVLNNVKISDINTTFVDSSSAYVDGGVFNIDAGAVVKNLVIENCDVTGSGGRSSLVGISEPSAEVTIKNTKLNGTKYMVYASAPIAELTVEGCTVENVSSWVVMMNNADSVGAVLTIDGNTFNNCSDGIAKYLGSSQPEGAATVFTNNTLTNCKGHDGSDAKWFAIPGATSTITVSGNTLDGVEWVPGTAQGLGK